MTTQPIPSLQSELSIDHDSATPVYVQVSQGLQGLIAQGVFKEGHALPSERDLAHQLGVSRVTVRQALKLLTDQGFLSRRQGSGTFVSLRRIEQPLSALTGFTEDMRSRGLVPGGSLISFAITRPSPQEALSLGMSPMSEVVRVSRLRTASDIPLAIETSSIPVEIIGHLTPEEVTHRSLYAYLRDRGYHPSRALQHLRAQSADHETAVLLEVPEGSPLLATERITRDANGRVLEYARALYRGDRYDFIVELAH